MLTFITAKSGLIKAKGTKIASSVPPIFQGNAGHACRVKEKEAGGLPVRIIVEEKIYRSGSKQGIDDALIQSYSGHESRKSLEVYSKLAITDAQQEHCPYGG
jgi:hypothetical protein